MSIFEGFLSTPEILDAFGERHFLAAMLRFEAALARAQASAGLIPEAAAQTIIGSCKVDLFDVDKIVRDSGRAGSIAIPLVKSLQEAVSLFNPQAVPFVHFGSTSQDVIDTALALVTRDALALVQADLQIAIDALLLLAERHAADPVLARTLLQPASVTSFGLKCVGWAAPLVRSRYRLQAAAANALSLQLGGAVGTLSQMQALGPQVMVRMADDLQLKAPLATWHTQRDEWVALGCELGLMVGSLGKIAKDISLMGQYEVNEVAEPSAGSRAACASTRGCAAGDHAPRTRARPGQLAGRAGRVARAVDIGARQRARHGASLALFAGGHGPHAGQSASLARGATGCCGRRMVQPGAGPSCRRTHPHAIAGIARLFAFAGVTERNA